MIRGQQIPEEVGRYALLSIALLYLAGLVALPLLPGFLGYALEDAAAEFARHRREIQPFGFLAQLDAVDHPCHLRCPLQIVLISTCERRCQLYIRCR